MQKATDTALGTTSFYYDGNGVTSTHHLFGLDLIHVDDGSETRTVLGDGLGNGRVEMVGSAVETATTYEPYGKVLAQTGASGTVYGFTGEQYDILTSLVYLRARYYSPSLKIFLSRDPFPGLIRLPASQHGYSYVHNNPVNLTDPSGMVIETPLDIAFIIYDIFQLGYDIYKVHTTTGKEQQMYRQRLGVDVAATALDVLMLFIPGGTGGGMAYRGGAAAGSRGVINVSTDAIRITGVLDDLVRTVGRGTQWLVKALQSSPLLCSTSGGSGGSGNGNDADSGDRRNVGSHEDAGGHTTEKHIGRSEHWLRQRLADEPGLDFASSFLNSSVANQTHGRFVRQYREQINAWLKTDKTLFVGEIDMGFPIGKVVERGRKGAFTTFSASRARLVLKRDSSPQGWHFLTSYPIK